MNRQPVPPPSVGRTTSAGPDCHSAVCITCSDVAIAVRVRHLVPGGLAIVDTDAGPEEISIALIDAEPGDVVLVHAKEAIAVVEKAR